MDWLLQQAVDTLKAVIGGLAGTWLFIKYLLPRMMKSTAKQTIDEAAEHPKIKPLIEEAKPLINQLKTLLAKAEDLNLQEIVDLAKSIRVTVETLNKQTPPPPPPRGKQTTQDG